MKYVVLTGRFLYSLIFLLTIVHHFSPGAISIVASAGVPAANYLVPISGILAVLGAFSIMVGYKAKIGAWLIVIFLVPVTFIMHPFWREADLFQAEMQLAMFAKNISLLGAALIICYFGAGPMSFDEEKRFRIVKPKARRIGRAQTISQMESDFIRERLKKYT